VYDTGVFVPLNDVEEIVSTNYQWGHCFSYLINTCRADINRGYIREGNALLV
jgi:hypothetical protein